MRPLTDQQIGMLRALDELGAHDLASAVSAALVAETIASWCGEPVKPSSVTAARTRLDAVRTYGLAEASLLRAGVTYWLTDAGRAAAEEADR